MVSKLGERHPVTLRGNKSTKWHDDTSRNTLIAKSLAPSKIDFPRLIRHLVLYLGDAKIHFPIGIRSSLTLFGQF